MCLTLKSNLNSSKGAHIQSSRAPLQPGMGEGHRLDGFDEVMPCHDGVLLLVKMPCHLTLGVGCRQVICPMGFCAIPS